MVKKKRNRDKEKHRPTKPRFARKADLFYQSEIAPCAKAYHQAMKAKRYDAAADAFQKLENLRKHHSLLLARNEKIRIK